MISLSSEKLLDRALERQFSLGPFRQWFLERTRFAGESSDVVLLRSNWSWGRVKLRVWNAEIKDYQSITREGETDLLVVLQSAHRGRFALHVENKLGSGRFTKLQPEMYRARAAAWAGKSKYGDYEEWETVLVSPISFYERNRYESSKFNRFVSHEDLAIHIPEFRNSMVAA